MHPNVPVEHATELASWVIGGLVAFISTLFFVIRHMYITMGKMQSKFDDRLDRVTGESQSKMERAISEFTEQTTMMVERMRENNVLTKEVTAVLESCRINRESQNGQ